MYLVKKAIENNTPTAKGNTLATFVRISTTSKKIFSVMVRAPYFNSERSPIV